ncbi:MAG TPA: hypothetical protein VFD73_19305 [Gemmatimonadales bacterium]|nr:hypothetical protein [Gemmatimonadales bacterium]
MGSKLRLMTALPLAAIAVALLASATPAQAAPHRAAAVVSGAGWAGRAVPRSASGVCGYITDPIYTVSAPAVQLDPFYHRVIGTAGINVWAKMNCSATVIFKLETKVCGFWGCNSHEMASSQAMELPESGPVTSELVANCRPGTNSYQMVYRVTWVDYAGDSLERHTDENASNWVKGSC